MHARTTPPSVGAGPRPVLRHRSDDTLLRARGYVIPGEPLVSAEVAAHLRREFGEIHGWDGDGWHNAFNTEDLDARFRAQDTLDEALSGVLAGRFVGFEPFFSTYLVKWPGVDRNENFLFLHQDWTYIDEADGSRSYVVFLALDDIDESNGRVEVLPGGNRIDGGRRGSSLISPWLRHDDLLRSHLVGLSLGAGQCAVWDGAIVHGSGQNHSGIPRVAVGVWMRPIGAQLVHYRQEAEGLAARHDISLDFFRHQTPASLDRRLAERPPAAVVSAGFDDLDERALAEILDDNDRRLAVVVP